MQIEVLDPAIEDDDGGSGPDGTPRRQGRFPTPLQSQAEAGSVTADGDSQREGRFPTPLQSRAGGESVALAGSVMAAGAVPRGLRADAQRNYGRILAVARAAVAERGSDIVLEDIAREAGVGIGTLYRHFPTRQALFEAAFLDEALELKARAEDLAESPRPFDVLIDWLRLQMDFGAHGHSMGAAVMNAKHTEGSEIQKACVSMREAGGVLLEKARAAGQVRPEVEMIDVVRLIHGIVIINERAPDPERASRMFDVVVAGIRA